MTTGFRFRKSIKVGRFARINLSKGGASVSLGGPGARVNIGKNGVRSTVGLPGTGLSYSARLGGPAARGNPLVGSVGAPETTQKEGCLILVGLGVVVLCVATAPEGSGFWVGVVGVVGLGALIHWSQKRAEANKAAEDQAAVSAYVSRLRSEFGDEATNNILEGQLWMGASGPMVVEMFGEPEGIDEKVTKAATVHSYKYFGPDGRRIALRVVFTDGAVTSWEDKR